MELLTTILPWLQIGLSVVLIGLILLQQSEAGMGGMGGGGQIRTKRGLEKGLFIATIIISILFAVSAIASLLLSAN